MPSRLLLGDKASADVIRSGADKAMISAVFEVEGGAEKTVAQILENNGIDQEDESIILRREIAAGGKGRVFVNNQPATVAVLRQLAPYLATIHAQNESLLSFRRRHSAAPARHLCQHADRSDDRSFRTMERIFRRGLTNCERDEQDRLRLLDLWTFQAREIEEAKLQAGEDERLETEKRVLANAEKIYSAAMNAFDLLYEGNDSTSASLRAAQKHIEELARYEPKFQETMSQRWKLPASASKMWAPALRDYAGGIEASPEHLAEVEDRLAAIDRLKRKYGPTLEDVINLGSEVSRKLSEMENKDEVLRQLRGELAKAAGVYLGAAQAISKKRYEAARKAGETG